MINNRQGGRRRGRGGGGRPQSNAPSGNRQDNRQRGNAAQLLEKYKQLARDAQLQSDRVQSEYYLQFADHYFRVLNESRARFEDQRRGRDDDFEDEGEEEMAAADGDDGQAEEHERPRRDHQAREQREQRGDGEQRNGEGRFDRARGRRPRREFNGDAPGNGEDEARIALESLPPAIAATTSSDEGEDAPRARRRTRRPRTDEAGDPAPAVA